MNKILNNILENIFYSNLFQKIRLNHYDDAYKQGRFDQEIETDARVAIKDFVTDNKLEEMFNLKSLDSQILYAGEIVKPANKGLK